MGRESEQKGTVSQDVLRHFLLPAGEFLKQLRAAQSLSSKMYSCMILTLRVGQCILAVDLICMCYFVKWERR